MSEATNSNALGMSDEEFLKSPLPDTTNTVDSSEEAVDTALESTEDSDSSTESDDNAEVSTEDLEDSPNSTSESDEDTSAQDSSDGEEVDTSEPEEASKEVKKEVKKDETSTEYKSFYDKVTAPFKANSRDMQVNSPEEVIQLMQMGANYAKKMAALKPSLKSMKVLEKHGLLDDEKLGYLVDLHNKNPEAIKKLLKDSGIDPLDYDLNEASNYKPKSHKIDDAELAMDEVLDTIKETPTYTKTLDIIANKWDDASRHIIATNPQLLSVINEHVSNGVYEKVWSEVERERTFNRLTNVSDLEAYRGVGEKLFGQAEQASSSPTKKIAPRKETGNDLDRIRKKQAASPSRSKPSSSTDNSFNPLSMSDDEFLKAANSKFV